MAKNTIIEPLNDEFPSHYADRLGLDYTSQVTIGHKKGKGQFFTPTSIAHLMASFAEVHSEQLRILDPGCGTAVLSCGLIEVLISKYTEIKTIELVVYETDESLESYIDASLTYLKLWLKDRNVEFTYTICTGDFILENADSLIDTPQMFVLPKELFDIVISNPPYFKLSKDDKRTKAAQVVVSGQPNIYAIFMAVAAKLLKENGELIFITPRSFTSGNYFRTFRGFFFDLIQLDCIHLFVSRKDTFSRDNVLQETVIIKGTRKQTINGNHNVVVSTSHGLKDVDQPAVKLFAQQDLIDLDSCEKILHFPTNNAEEQILTIFKNWTGGLHKYNIQISTGPVVAFRAPDYIYDEFENGTVFLAPLFWLHNVTKMTVSWPFPKPNKGQYIRMLPETRSMLIPNKNYVFLRRFSSKDDKSRLVAAPYFCNVVETELIGVENKVNYIYRPKGHLDRNEIVGLCALLNSELFDNYFRMFNGNVNVSATELREMSLPPLEDIKEIGDRIIFSNDYSIENVNQIFNEHFQLISSFNNE